MNKKNQKNTVAHREKDVSQQPTSQASFNGAISNILQAISDEKAATEIYAQIASHLISRSHATGVCVYVKGSETGTNAESVYSTGVLDYQKPLITETESLQKQRPPHYVFPLYHGDEWIGAVVIQSSEELKTDTLTPLIQCCSTAYIHKKSWAENQHLQERLQILNSLNEILIHNTGLERLMKGLVRESAFNFSADISVIYLCNPLQNSLELTGAYGCNPKQIPSTISQHEGLIGQVMSTGGQLSISDLTKHKNHKINYLQKLGVLSLHICCLELQEKILGTMIVGFRRQHAYDAQEVIRFEEFCRGTALAISNSIAQTQLKAYTERLEELVEKRTAELEIQTDKAKQANEAKSHFLANMTHELRTPITAILGYSSIMNDEILGEVTPQQREGLSAIIRSSEHLKSLIDDVLNLARVEAGKEEAKIVPLSLREMLENAYQLMKQSAFEKGVTLRDLDLSEELSDLEFLCDRKHFQQILINLVSNAIKYTPAGGSAWIEARQVEEMIEISVHDTGVGLSDQEKSDIFERFNRTGNPYSQQQVGTGLGLALTKKLVELNMGEIRAEDNPGGGSRFILTYPTSHSHYQASETENPEAQAMTKLDGLSILVVDDHSDTRNILENILHAAGAIVEVRETVDSARQVLKDFQPDVLLTEISMPGESGLELIKFVRAAGEDSRQIPIVVLSSRAFDTDQLAAFGAGANAFYPKPFRPNDLLEVIRELTLQYAITEG